MRQVKARRIRIAAKKAARDMFNAAYGEWLDAKPPRIFFIRRYLWKKKRPKYEDYEIDPKLAKRYL